MPQPPKPVTLPNGRHWPSMAACAKELGISYQAVSTALRVHGPIALQERIERFTLDGILHASMVAMADHANVSDRRIQLWRHLAIKLGVSNDVARQLHEQPVMLRGIRYDSLTQAAMMLKTPVVDLYRAGNWEPIEPRKAAA